MLDTTSFTWIVRERASVAHINGVKIALEAVGVLANADLRIMTVSAERGVELPAGLTGLNGAPLPAGVLTVHNLPEQGILFQGTLS